MAENKGLLNSGWGMAMRNKRYIFWFWLLNVILAWFGTAAFANHAHGILDQSLYSDRLVHGLDVSAVVEVVARPEFGPLIASRMPAIYFVTLFFIATVLFLPGVFQGYASNYRLPRDDFFRACGRNLWRFIRLLIVAGLVMVIVAGLLFAAQDGLVKKAGDSTNELLPFEVQMTTLAIIFFVMTALRIWFDLAEADVVLSDQNAVRKSIVAGFRHTWRGFGRLLASYLLITIVAAIFLVAGLLSWMRFVAPENLLRAFAVSQVTLLLLLIPRFWQRGVAVAYWKDKMLVPVVAAPVIPLAPVAASPVSEPPVSPVIPSTPTATQGT